MKKLLAAFALFAPLCLATQASAQSSLPNGGTSPSGSLKNPQTLQPKGPSPDFAPPAIPGAGFSAPPTAITSTAPKGPAGGDPNAALFTAINKGDYGGVQDALSRGADLNAQNSLGETPVSMSIALNRNTITFLLLSVRNELGDGPPPGVATPVMSKPGKPVHIPQATPVKMVAPPPVYHIQAQSQANNPGTPNASAGFLGFGPAK